MAQILVPRADMRERHMTRPRGNAPQFLLLSAMAATLACTEVADPEVPGACTADKCDHLLAQTTDYSLLVDATSWVSAGIDPPSFRAVAVQLSAGSAVGFRELFWGSLPIGRAVSSLALYGIHQDERVAIVFDNDQVSAVDRDILIHTLSMEPIAANGVPTTLFERQQRRRSWWPQSANVGELRYDRTNMASGQRYGVDDWGALLIPGTNSLASGWTDGRGLLVGDHALHMRWNGGLILPGETEIPGAVAWCTANDSSSLRTWTSQDGSLPLIDSSAVSAYLCTGDYPPESYHGNYPRLVVAGPDRMLRERIGPNTCVWAVGTRIDIEASPGGHGNYRGVADVWQGCSVPTMGTGEWSWRFTAPDGSVRRNPGNTHPLIFDALSRRRVEVQLGPVPNSTHKPRVVVDGATHSFAGVDERTVEGHAVGLVRNLNTSPSGSYAVHDVAP